MRGIAFALLFLMLCACSTTQKQADPMSNPDDNLRASLAQSYGARLADAELALNRADTAEAIRILDGLDAATKDWEHLTPRETIVYGWFEAQSREIRFIATAFGEAEAPDKLKELFGADTDRLFERFVGDGSTLSSPAGYQRYAISGRDDLAERGFKRVFALLEGKPYDVKRFRMLVLHASTLAAFGKVEEGRAELELAAALLAKLQIPKVEDVREYGTYCLLPAFFLASQNKFAEALAHVNDVLKDNPEHPAKARMERFQKGLTELVEGWNAEQPVYAAEPKDLPRVEIETDKGKLVITLFEDDAPNTVASFITLVEKGFYDGTVFHRVVPHFVVQGGDPDGTGEGGPGYAIKLEATRKHFRGTLGMARGADPDSAGSQFYFCLAAITTHHLDKGYAVFGRVTQGLEVMDALRLGSKIIKARVVNKRSHEYKVVKLPEKKE